MEKFLQSHISQCKNLRFWLVLWWM